MANGVIMRIQEIENLLAARGKSENLQISDFLFTHGNRGNLMGTRISWILGMFQEIHNPRMPGLVASRV